MADLKELKVGLEEPKAEQDVQLPELPQWDKIFGRPTSLGDLDPTAEALLESNEATILSLGDVAYLDSITTTYITDNSITTPKILAGAVTASRISVANLSAIKADLGSITAGTITGVTITGGTVRTSSGSTRVEMNGSSNRFEVYKTGVLRVSVADDTIAFRNASGTLVGQMWSATTNFFIDSLNSMSINASNILSLNGGGRHITISSVGISINDDLDMNNNGITDVYSIQLGGVTRTSWPSAGATTLSGLTIDTNKNWGGYGITNLDNISFNGSGSYIEDLSALYFQSRTSNPGSPEGSIWFYSSGGTVEMRTFIGGSRYRFVLQSV